MPCCPTSLYRNQNKKVPDIPTHCNCSQNKNTRLTGLDYAVWPRGSASLHLQSHLYVTTRDCHLESQEERRTYQQDTEIPTEKLVLETRLQFCLSTRGKRGLELVINKSKCHKSCKNKEDELMEIKRKKLLYVM